MATNDDLKARFYGRNDKRTAEEKARDLIANYGKSKMPVEEGRSVSECYAKWLDVNKIDEFANHPFRVVEDENFQKLCESIEANGVRTPCVVRQKSENPERYEMISGHRRLAANKKLGKTLIPCMIRKFEDDDAIIEMVESNLTARDDYLPSEKAHAYKMLKDAYGRKERNGDGNKARNVIAEKVGIKGRQVQNYLNLNKLTPDLLKTVDDRKLSLDLASATTMLVDKNYLDADGNITDYDGYYRYQKYLANYIDKYGKVNAQQIADLRKVIAHHEMSEVELINTLNGVEEASTVKRKVKTSWLDKTVNEYFPPEYTSDEVQNVIEELLKDWKLKHNA